MKYQYVFPLPQVRIAVIIAFLVTLGSAAQAVEWGHMKADTILFLGNSITFHGPYSGWSTVGGFGMAASAPQNDYVHLLASSVDTRTGGQLALNPEPTNVPAWSPGNPLPAIGDANIVNIADLFERNYATWDNSRIQQQIADKPDIVVLQFGENMVAGDMGQFKTALETLMTGLKNSSNPNIFVTSFILGSNAAIDAVKQQVCAEDPSHRVFVDLSNVGQNSANIGLFSHPSDQGMAIIANTIYNAMDAHSVVPEPGSCSLFVTGLLALLAWGWRRRK